MIRVPHVCQGVLLALLNLMEENVTFVVSPGIFLVRWAVNWTAVMEVWTSIACRMS